MEKPAHTHYYLRFAEEKGDVELREFFAIGLRSGIGIGAEVVETVEDESVTSGRRTSHERERDQGFKRINFFKGFLTTEKDWNDAERYHIDKRRLHNRCCTRRASSTATRATCGSVARARGDLSVEVQPGYAIDGQGNDLMLCDATIRTSTSRSSGCRRRSTSCCATTRSSRTSSRTRRTSSTRATAACSRSCRVELSQTEPDISARGRARAASTSRRASTAIRDARDPRRSARPTRSTCASRRAAGVSGSTLPPALRLRLETLLTAGPARRDSSTRGAA